MILSKWREVLKELCIYCIFLSQWIHSFLRAVRVQGPSLLMQGQSVLKHVSILLVVAGSPYCTCGEHSVFCIWTQLVTQVMLLSMQFLVHVPSFSKGDMLQIPGVTACRGEGSFSWLAVIFKSTTLTSSLAAWRTASAFVYLIQNLLTASARPDPAGPWARCVHCPWERQGRCCSTCFVLNSLSSPEELLPEARLHRGSYVQKGLTISSPYRVIHWDFSYKSVLPVLCSKRSALKGKSLWIHMHYPVPAISFWSVLQPPWKHQSSERCIKGKARLWLRYNCGPFCGKFYHYFSQTCCWAEGL